MKEDDASDLDECSNFAKVMGAFGSHSDIKRRTKAERLAAMQPGDGRRRKKGEKHQFNTRVNDAVHALIAQLLETLNARDGRKWSQPELVEAAMSALAKQLGVRS